MKRHADAQAEPGQSFARLLQKHQLGVAEWVGAGVVVTKGAIKRAGPRCGQWQADVASHHERVGLITKSCIGRRIGHKQMPLSNRKFAKTVREWHRRSRLAQAAFFVYKVQAPQIFLTQSVDGRIPVRHPRVQKQQARVKAMRVKQVLKV